jgi:hypothetical protein
MEYTKGTEDFWGSASAAFWVFFSITMVWVIIQIIISVRAERLDTNSMGGGA